MADTDLMRETSLCAFESNTGSVHCKKNVSIGIWTVNMSHSVVVEEATSVTVDPCKMSVTRLLDHEIHSVAPSSALRSGKSESGKLSPGSDEGVGESIRVEVVVPVGKAMGTGTDWEAYVKHADTSEDTVVGCAVTVLSEVPTSFREVEVLGIR